MPRAAIASRFEPLIFQQLVFAQQREIAGAVGGALTQPDVTSGDGIVVDPGTGNEVIVSADPDSGGALSLARINWLA